MQGGGAASHQKDTPVVLPTQSVALAAGAIPAAALRGRYFHRSPLRFLPGRCPGLRCCSLPGGSECGERDCLAPSAIPKAGRQAAAFAQKMIFCAKVFDRTGRLLYIAFHNALVAQLDRATGYEPVGQEFESLRAHHKKRKRSAVTGWPLFSSPVFFPIPGGAVSGPCHAAGAHSYPSASRRKGNRGRRLCPPDTEDPLARPAWSRGALRQSAGPRAATFEPAVGKNRLGQ